MAFPIAEIRDSQGFDSKGYKVERENPAIKTEMDGGYMVSRPRHTRTPRKTWHMQWRSTTQALRDSVAAHWDSMKGSSTLFTFKDPDTLATVTVRYKDFDDEYKGIGPTRLWDMKVVVEQV